MRKIKKIGYGIVVIAVLGSTYTLGYLEGSGYFQKSEYDLSQDAVQAEAMKSLDEIFMQEYNVMTQAGRDSYGKFFAIYGDNEVEQFYNNNVYTVFYEEDESGSITRIKVIYSDLTEKVYITNEYENVSVLGATTEGIVLAATKDNAEYNLFYPLNTDLEPVFVQGSYTLQEDSSHCTDGYTTTYRNAMLVMNQIIEECNLQGD
jgi:hypothetical protein